MTKKYQTNEIDTSVMAVPGQVSVAMEEIAADMREGLLALAVGAGLQVMAQLMEADVTAACGAKGKPNPDRAATRHGTEAGSEDVAVLPNRPPVPQAPGSAPRRQASPASAGPVPYGQPDHRSRAEEVTRAGGSGMLVTQTPAAGSWSSSEGPEGS